MEEKPLNDEKTVTVISAPKKKTKAEKISMIVVFTVGPILLTFILYLYGVFSFIGVRIFNGDRISGEIAILIDDKDIKPTSATAQFSDTTENTMSIDEISTTDLDEIEFNTSEDISAIAVALSSFGTPGGEEGVYTLDFVLDKDELYQLTGKGYILDLEDDIHIKFNYNNEKWYYITSLKLLILIKSGENGLTFDITADYYADNAARYKVTDNFEKTVYLADLQNNNEIVINLWD